MAGREMGRGGGADSPGADNALSLKMWVKMKTGEEERGKKGKINKRDEREMEK